MSVAIGESGGTAPGDTLQGVIPLWLNLETTLDKERGTF